MKYLFGYKKGFVISEQTEDMSPLEQTVDDFINMNLSEYVLPEEFSKVAVDIFDTEYNRKECAVTILFEKPFNLKDSDRMHDIMNEIKKERIKNLMSLKIKKSLLNVIETTGLYRFIEMTNLSLFEVTEQEGSKNLKLIS